MNKSLVFVITVVIGVTFAAKATVIEKTLCEDPYIHAADHLLNDTIRVYRGNFYWELSGLPAKVATLTGPYKITHKYMAPVERGVSIMTVIGGPIAGNTWKFQDDRMWQWNKNAELEVGGKAGMPWMGNIPPGGFHCAMNDGDYDKKGYPMMIALKGIKSFYWKTRSKIFEPVGDIYKGYNETGQFKEYFPPDVTACVVFKADPKAKYYVYLFRLKEYCYRPIIGEEGCKEWRQNTELFACGNTNSGATKESDSEGGNNDPSGDKPGAKPGDNPQDKPEDKPEGKPDGGQPPGKEETVAPQHERPKNDYQGGEEESGSGGNVIHMTQDFILFAFMCYFLF